MNKTQDNRVFDAIDGRQLEQVSGAGGALVRNIARGIGVGGLLAAPVVVTHEASDLKAKIMGAAMTVGAGGGWLLHLYKQGYKDAAADSARRLAWVASRIR